MKVAGGHTPSYWLQTKIPSFRPLVTALSRCLPYLSTQGVEGGYNDHPSNEPDIHKWIQTFLKSEIKLMYSGCITPALSVKLHLLRDFIFSASIINSYTPHTDEVIHSNLCLWPPLYNGQMFSSWQTKNRYTDSCLKPLYNRRFIWTPRWPL